MSADKRNDDQEMSMEEILASIRRYVSDEAPETNLKEGSIEYNSGKTADVIRLTEIIDSQEATIQTENLQNQQSNDGLDKAHQQARAETY
ncbi:MAG: hypothetical protein Q8J97_12355, partial [Flavobacteriaceae bacterium]|nr:hypothetical protein [Flavobacteriaceae bacterium]